MIKLPTWDECAEKGTELSEIEFFIHQNEPAGRSELAFRKELQAALNEAYEMGKMETKSMAERKNEWPFNNLYDGFEAVCPPNPSLRNLTRREDGNGYECLETQNYFAVYCAGFHNCNDMYAG